MNFGSGFLIKEGSPESKVEEILEYHNERMGKGEPYFILDFLAEDVENGVEIERRAANGGKAACLSSRKARLFAGAFSFRLWAFICSTSCRTLQKRNGRRLANLIKRRRNYKKRALMGTPKRARNIPGRIRTCDLRFRKPSLYPTELRGLMAISRDIRSDICVANYMRRGTFRQVRRRLSSRGRGWRDPRSRSICRRRRDDDRRFRRGFSLR